MENRLTTTDQAWCDELLLALRLRDVPGSRIGEVLAEVQSHVAETGEDPAEAFGTPQEYADEVARALDITPSRWQVGASDVALTVLFGVGSFLLADALWALGAGGDALLGLPAWVAAAVAVLMVGAGLAWLRATARREPDDAVVDPRTGADMVPFPRWRVALLVAVPVLTLTAMLVGGHLVGR